MKRYVGKCKKCKAGASVLAERGPNVMLKPDDWRYSYRTDDGRTLVGHRLNMADPLIECPNKCGAIRMEAVQGKYNPSVECNSKCMGSKGPSCECSCGGKNHGASWS